MHEHLSRNPLRAIPRTAVAVAAATAVVALLGGCTSAAVVKEAELRSEVNRLASGNEMVCRFERPVGSRIKQRICMTPQEAELREMANLVLYRNSLVALHGGTP